MRAIVQKHPFDPKALVLDYIKTNGLWSHSLIVEASPALPTYWHRVGVHGFVLVQSGWKSQAASANSGADEGGREP